MSASPSPSLSSFQVPEKRPRGRPRKNPLPTPSAEAATGGTADAPLNGEEEEKSEPVERLQGSRIVEVSLLSNRFWEFGFGVAKTREKVWLRCCMPIWSK
ncbi:hypothetical protein BT69DRAFT_473740 [Atractiella rhizophila]|nr:hypothetical protein BT69DRAFT_473740 [Atractiella rhizophila]